MSTKMPRASRLPAAAPIVLGVALLTSVFTVTSRPNTTRGAGTAPLRGATAVAQPSICKGYKTYSVPRVAPLNTHKTYKAMVTTNKGAFTITFDPKHAPITVESFIFLARRHYFDGVPFHRVLPGFVIQGGDPTGTGGCGPGYQFPDERVTQPYVRGTLAMANAGPNTNGSQFFVVLNNGTSLNQAPNYTIFGKVTSGISTIDRIASVRRGYRDVNGQQEQSVPLEKVYMKIVSIQIS